MKKRWTALILTLLCLLACGAAADDYGKAVVDAPSGKLHLREEASSKSESMGLYFTGTQVTLKSDPDEEWVEVKIGRERGYMYGEYLKTGSRADRVTPRFQAGTVQATNYARLRKGPSTEYQFICKLPDGADVTVMGETDEHWYYVKYGSEKGFVAKNLVYTRGDVYEDEDPKYEVEYTPQYRPQYTPQKTWRTAYREWLTENGDAYNTYALIYVNDDDIPELAVDTGAEAGGCRILTYGSAGLQALQTQRRHFTYIRRGNLLLNSDGHMDSYYDYVYTISGGGWQSAARGLCWGWNGGYSEVLRRYICDAYMWNGKTVTMAEYLVSLSSLYPQNRAEEPDFVYTHEEMMSLLWE